MIEKALKEFTRYTDCYKSYGKMIELKIKHTKRVTEIAKNIAKSENLSKEQIEIATLCGLLHDIGRFEQWKNYGTYSDLKSIDHGDLGYKILKENNYLSTYTNQIEYHSSILKAVKYHNKFAVPKNVKKEEKIFCNIARDADKIDILYLLVGNELDFHPDDSKITDVVWKELMNQKSINRKEVKTKADRIAIFLAFPFDLNYSYSFQIIKKENYMNNLMDKIEKEASLEFQKQLKELRPIINQYIEERYTC